MLPPGSMEPGNIVNADPEGPRSAAFSQELSSVSFSVLYSDPADRSGSHSTVTVIKFIYFISI